MGSQGNSYTYNNVTFAENEEDSPWEPLHVQKGFKPDDSAVSIFYGCRSTTFCLGLREKYWREHVRDMLAGIDGNSTPCLLLDPLTAQQFIDRGGFDTKAKLIRFIHETAEMPAGRYWDLQLVQNYVYPWATFGQEPMASWLKAKEDEPIRIFPEKDINVVVVGGEANAYWRIMGAKYRKTVSVDDVAVVSIGARSRSASRLSPYFGGASLAQLHDLRPLVDVGAQIFLEFRRRHRHRHGALPRPGVLDVGPRHDLADFRIEHVDDRLAASSPAPSRRARWSTRSRARRPRRWSAPPASPTSASCRWCRARPPCLRARSAPAP